MNIEQFNTLNKKLNKLMPLITPTGVILALMLGDVFAPLKPIVNPLFGVMTFLGAMKISFKDMLDALKKPLFIIVFALASFIVMPIIAELISVIFFGHSTIKSHLSEYCNEKKKIESSKFIQRANVTRMDILLNTKKYQPSF